MKKIRLLVADECLLLREGLKKLLQPVRDFSVIGEAGDGEQAISQVERLQPDVAVIEYDLPKVDGLGVTRAIRSSDSSTRILILTNDHTEEHVRDLLQAGANGYMLKESGIESVIAGIRAVVAGECYLGPLISKFLLEDFIRQTHNHVPRPTTKNSLTKREMEVLRHVALGSTSEEIARKLFLSIKTVNTHRANIKQKLDIHETAGLVRYAIESGIVAVHPHQPAVRRPSNSLGTTP